MKKELLRIENLKKGSLLKQIELQIFEEEITYCIFDNIQEKHMFLEIISGNIIPDFIKAYHHETEVPEQQITKLLTSHIATVSVNSNLIDTITIDENLFLMRPGVKTHWVKNRDYRNEASRLFHEFGINIDLNKSVAHLTCFEKIQVELIKAYLLDKEIIILTDLSNCLSSLERRKMWILIEKLGSRGKACIMIEPLEDINFKYLDTIMAVTHGRTCFVKRSRDCDYTMLHMILYHDEMRKRIENENGGEERRYGGGNIQIRNLYSEYLKKICFTIPKGEIVKLLCVDEHSYEELSGIVRGKVPVKEGDLCVEGSARPIRKYFRGLEDGIGVVEGNPVRDSLFTELTVLDNLKILLSRKASAMWMVPKYKRSIKLILHDIIPEEIYDRKVKDLEPEDIQKVAYCKWLLYSPKLLICIQPFAEGNIKAREQAREMIYMLEARGIPLMLLTSNASELNYCRGRDMYIRHGKIVGKEQAYQYLNAEDV